MPPSVASETSSDGQTFVPFLEESNATERIAREHAASPRDIKRLIAPTLHHYSGSPLSRAGCVLLDLLPILLNTVSPAPYNHISSPVFLR